MRRSALLAACLVLAACSEAPAGDAVVTVNLDGTPVVGASSPTPAGTQAAGLSACSTVTFETVPLTHCTADPAQHRIAMANAPAGGQPYGSLSTYAASADAGSVAFAFNGGIFGDDLKAVGYYVENGERLTELERGEGDGNFYMKPNGVFFGTGGQWRVLASEAFVATVGDRPQFGTQSGPMLVIDGKLHPDIQDNGPSRAIRNGVGVDAKGRTHFVIADAPLSFGQLARYFRDEVKAPNALHLDSQTSALWDPANGRLDQGRAGPIIVASRIRNNGREGTGE
ncbi:phosphodiester glycosidase family protein [Erythrobacter sp. NFXS35]|uniref:phosphodiester glycosidase family protein n=1 Tax=Erythrobacter sp. NFXS35 TaxID=2818436 RepID=UPI0032DEB84C